MGWLGNKWSGHQQFAQQFGQHIVTAWALLGHTKRTTRTTPPPPSSIIIGPVTGLRRRINWASSSLPSSRQYRLGLSHAYHCRHRGMPLGLPSAMFQWSANNYYHILFGWSSSPVIITVVCRTVNTSTLPLPSSPPVSRHCHAGHRLHAIVCHHGLLVWKRSHHGSALPRSLPDGHARRQVHNGMSVCHHFSLSRRRHAHHRHGLSPRHVTVAVMPLISPHH